jgi:electron transport complex protein RnfC
MNISPKGGGVVFRLGGSMMGREIDNLDIPIIKCINGIIAVKPSRSAQSDCIRCGRCADVCPMELLPLYFHLYAENSDAQGLTKKHVGDCIECGCCEHICAARIPLVDAIKRGKAIISREK